MKVLEKIINRETIADSFAMITWSIAVEAPRELLLMSVGQTFWSRLAGIPIDLVIGRPYGIYNTWIRKKFNSEEVEGLFTKSRLKRTLADTFAFTTAMAPVYTASLHYIVHADLKTTVAAVTSGALYSLWQGAPYGVYNGIIRKGANRIINFIKKKF